MIPHWATDVGPRGGLLARVGGRKARPRARVGHAALTCVALLRAEPRVLGRGVEFGFLDFQKNRNAYLF